MHLGRIDNTPKYRKFLWLFFLIAIGFCFFIFDYALSRVTIQIFPKNITQTVKLTAFLDQSASSVNLEKKIFPSKVTEKEISLQQIFPATGIKSDPGFAHGEIMIESKRDKDIPLPAGYKLVYGAAPVQGPWKDKIIFALDNDIIIPAGGTIKTTATAINKGERGNVDPGLMYFASMATWNRERLIPQAVSKFTGGMVLTKIVSGQDIDFAKEELLKKAKRDSTKEFLASLASDKSAREDLSLVHVDQFTIDKQVGEAAENFNVQLKGRIKAFIFPSQELKEALKKQIASQYSNADLLSIDDDSFNIGMDSMDIENGKAQITTSLSGIFAPKFSTEIFEKSDLAGFNETAIRQKYSSNPAIDKIQVKFFPFWRKTIPSLSDHVFIEIVK